ncbi:MAG: hypothetical protein ACR2RF_27890 [Geminicoccaceae bacterium]
MQQTVTKKGRILEFCRNMHAALLRIICIFIGIYMMGVEAFFSFYFLHMILTSLIRFYTLDSDVDVQRMVRRKGSIGWQYLGYISSLHLITSLLILALYWSFITLFDRQIAPGTLDMGFAKLYALIILGNLITPLTGIIKAKAPQVVQEVVLRGQYAVTLACIIGFVAASVDAALLPYAWLLSSLAMAALRLGFAVQYLWGTDTKSPSTPLSRQRARDLWRSILSLSAMRTDRRVTFLGAKAVISALLGPFASLTLKAVGFNDDTKRQRYADRAGRTWPLRQLGRRLSDSPAQRISIEHVLLCILLASTVALAILLAMGGHLDPFLLLGSLALSCKILAISLRALLLRKLTS